MVSRRRQGRKCGGQAYLEESRRGGMTAHIATNAMRRVWLAVVFTAVSMPSYSQFLPDLQAKTPEEYDAYLDAIDGPVIEKGAAFEREFPESALRLPVCELMAREWRSRGDAVQAAAAAERGLAIAPDYVPLLVEIADLLAHCRLGRLYAVSGRTAEARRELEEAARSDEKTLRERANAALAALPEPH